MRRWCKNASGGIQNLTEGQSANASGGFGFGSRMRHLNVQMVVRAQLGLYRCGGDGNDHGLLCDDIVRWKRRQGDGERAVGIGEGGHVLAELRLHYEVPAGLIRLAGS